MDLKLYENHPFSRSLFTHQLPFFTTKQFHGSWKRWVVNFGKLGPPLRRDVFEWRDWPALFFRAHLENNGKHS